MKISKMKLLISVLFFGYAFLYLPILSVVLFSFNSSRSVTLWTGHSLEWYEKLLQNQKIMKAALLSIEIAVATATLAVLIGTLAAIVMVRFHKFKGRGFFSGLVTAPLVMPDVMVGIALLLLFVMTSGLFGWTINRGFTTITIGHATVGIAYVIVVIRARLLEFDRSVEEAALDLGARPVKVFLTITLPIISPAIAAGWLLAFTLSFDDVILSSFLGGPGSTTLPMIIFSSVRFGVTPEINALATIILSLIMIGVMVTTVLLKRNHSSSNYNS